jgi:ABC-type multidrug transport system ATPase subunit
VNLFNGGVGDRPCGTYSGGMKRRLSVAISLIGDPPVVFLDEPSTGLDPASRATLWEVIKRAKQSRAIVLTTHAMEEAEELCDRLGIFVDGSLRCVGNPKELTSRYGGFLVLTLTTGSALRAAEAEAFVKEMSPNAQLTYALGSTLKFDLPLSENNLASVFAAVSERKQALDIVDWGVANMTLEEVFIKLAREIGATTKE